jgi:hypothetical protein
MSALAELQQRFCDALRSADTPPEALLNQIVNDDGYALERFNVYRNNFVVLNAEALADMYPAILRLIGQEAFMHLAVDYVRSHPPGERTLLTYGERFPEVLARHPALQDHPYLADVARIELYWTCAYHGEERPALTPVQVESIAPEAFGGVYLQPHPALYHLASPYPAYRIWLANQGDENLSGDGQLLDLDSGGEQVVIHRAGVDVTVTPWDRADYEMLLRLSAGDSLSGAYQAAAALNANFDLSGFLARHLFDGTFTALAISPFEERQLTQSSTGRAPNEDTYTVRRDHF